MHLVILGIAAVLLILYLNARNASAAANRHGGADIAGHPEFDKVAFISRGKLFCKTAGKDLTEIHSPYVQGVMDRMEASRKRHAWKEGTAFQTSWISGRQQKTGDSVAISATSARFSGDDKVLYFLRDETFGGLFEYNLESGEEKRLVHRQNLFFEDLNLGRDNQILCTQRAVNGSSNIVLLSREGGDDVELTGGDTVDCSPDWVAGKEGQVVFQSSGLARNEGGFVVAQGPTSLMLLDQGQTELTTVLEDPKTDFLQPRVSEAGDLYYIRRPYEPPKYSGGNLLLDTLLFPFRLLRAVFHYLNFFSLVYTRKPLTSASGPEVQADLKEMLIKGKRISAENALRKERRVNGIRSLVPRSWQLIKRDRYGNEQVMATNVASFDLTKGGTVVYTNGFGVFVLENGRSSVLLRDKLIADIFVG